MSTVNNALKEFNDSYLERLKSNSSNQQLKRCSAEFMQVSIDAKYSYNFSWMGVPIIQYPQDLIALQEIIWHVKPDIIVDLGVAHGGTTIFFAALLELVGGREVISVDIDIREHNRKMIENHKMSDRVRLIEGSSTDDETFQKVKKLIKNGDIVLVSADSMHTHDHVLNELLLYSPLVTKGSYFIVFDTIIEDLKPATFKERPWDVGDNPKTAVHEFLKNDHNFEVDMEIENKLLISAAPQGYLKRIA